MITVSIIIITLNEELYVGNILSDLCLQSRTQGKVIEVLVVDGGSTDRTKQVVLSFTDRLPVQFVRAPKRGYAAQKNYGANQAKGSTLLFLDADLRVKPNLLDTLLAAHRAHPQDIVTAKMLADSPRLTYRLGAALTHLYFYLQRLAGQHVAADQCVMLSKKVYTGIGGIDQQTMHAEMLEFMQRAFTRGSRTHWAPGATAKASVRRFEQTGRYRLMARYIRSELHRYRHKGKIYKDYVGYTASQPPRDTPAR